MKQHAMLIQSLMQVEKCPSFWSHSAIGTAFHIRLEKFKVHRQVLMLMVHPDKAAELSWDYNELNTIVDDVIDWNNDVSPHPRIGLKWLVGGMATSQSSSNTAAPLKGVDNRILEMLTRTRGKD